jgi:hypothetical protein
MVASKTRRRCLRYSRELATLGAYGIRPFIGVVVLGAASYAVVPISEDVGATQSNM